MTRSLLIFGVFFLVAAVASKSTCQKPDTQCSGPHEVYDCRRVSCKEDLCVKLVSKFRCNETEICTPGCYCESGFFREDVGQPCGTSCSCSNMQYAPACFPTPDPEDTQCSGPHEVYDCRRVKCKEDLCVKLVSKFRCNETEICTPGCYCEPGFFRESAGQPCGNACSCRNMQHAPACFPTPAPEETQCTGDNEEYGCKLTSCQKDTCESITARYACAKNEVCTPGCYCKSGFYRAKDGQPCKEICDCDNMKSSPDCLEISSECS